MALILCLWLATVGWYSVLLYLTAKLHEPSLIRLCYDVRKSEHQAMVDPLSITSLVVTLGAGFAKMFGEAIYVRLRHKVKLEHHTEKIVLERAATPADIEKITNELQAGGSIQIVNVTPKPPRPPRFSPGQRLLLCFAGLLIVALIPTLVHYWTAIIANSELLIFAVWLFFTMIAGMFVQVIVDNYQAGHPMFEINAPDLLVPIFFSLIVYYSIWSVAASAPRGLFSFYAAFLNGYFWRHVVSQAKPTVISQTVHVTPPVSPKQGTDAEAG
jgi:hypothetical protein